MKKILQMFLDGTGDTSSKRVMGIALVISGIVGCFTGMDNLNVWALLGAGLGIFGFTAVTKT
jgi:hypothetical protein